MGPNEQHILETLFVNLDCPAKTIQIEGLPENVAPLLKNSKSIQCLCPSDLTVSISCSQVSVLPNFAMTDYASQGKTCPFNVVEGRQWWGVMEGGGAMEGREWCRVMERGSSPGLVVAHVHLSLPMSTHCCLCLCVIAHVHSCLWVVIFVHKWLTLFMGSCFHSHTVVFVRGWSSLFVGVGSSLRSWRSSSFGGAPSSFVGSLSLFVGNGTVWWWGAIGGCGESSSLFKLA